LAAAVSPPRTRRQTVTLIRYPPPGMLGSLALSAAAWADAGSFRTETPLRRRRLSCRALSGNRRGLPHRAQALSHHSARQLQQPTGTDLVCGFSCGRMPPDQAVNIRLFAERVMPVMQHDAGFARARRRPRAEREAARRRVCAGVGAGQCHIVAEFSCSIRTHGSTPFATGGLAGQVDDHRKTAYPEQGKLETK
jgi:hypothetical protein